MKIALGCDPAGLELKNTIKDYLTRHHDIDDVGSFSTDPGDYTDFAALVAQAVMS